MSTSTVRKPRVKPTRRASLTRANASGGRILTLTVATARKVEISDYYLLPIPCEGGAAYEVRKLQGERETYHVCLAGEAPSCECKGFLRWGHCKHVESLTALQQANLL